MAFGESFQGMSDREILIEIATRQAVLELKVDGIRCPSPRCQDHATRLNTLETTELNRKDSGDSFIAWIGVFVAVVAIGVSILAVVGG